MLLPEAFLQSCLDEYTRPLERPHRTAALSTEGLLVLPDEKRIAAAEEGEDPPPVWRLATDPRPRRAGASAHRARARRLWRGAARRLELLRHETQGTRDRRGDAAVAVLGRADQDALAARLYYVVSERRSRWRGWASGGWRARRRRRWWTW